MAPIYHDIMIIMERGMKAISHDLPPATEWGNAGRSGHLPRLTQAYSPAGFPNWEYGNSSLRVRASKRHCVRSKSSRDNNNNSNKTWWGFVNEICVKIEKRIKA